MHTDSMHTDSSSSSSSSVGTAEQGRRGFATPQRAISSASSPGSWVVDPEDGGWHGVGSSSPPSSRTRQLQHQPDHHDESGRSGQISPSASSSSLHSWARLPLSPQSSLGAAVGMMAAGAKAAEYPAIGSPPRSPCGARTGGGCGGTAGEGLVSLAREEMSNDFDVKIYANPPVDADPVPANQGDRGDEDNEATTVAEDAGRDETGPTQTTREIGDGDGDGLSTVDVCASDDAGVATDAVHALSTSGVAPGPIPAGVENAVHAAPPPLLEAEVKVDSAATIEASGASVGVESRSVPPTNAPSSGAQEETSHLSHNTNRYASLENAGAETLARDGPPGAVAPPSSLASGENAETAVTAVPAVSGNWGGRVACPLFLWLCRAVKPIFAAGRCGRCLCASLENPIAFSFELACAPGIAMVS